MATLEDELRDLKEKNNELAQKVQYWKMIAAEKENEKLNLMKEMNELRLKLSRLRNTGSYEAHKLDAALQLASEKAISHLVIASNEIARGMEIAKAYMRDRQELDAQSPRWSNIGGTPPIERKEKVHKVPPLMLGGQSLQPVVALSRTMMNTSNPRSEPRNPIRNVSERAVPLHMLQDVYIPLTRIDIPETAYNNMDTDSDVNNADDSTEALGLDDDEERIEDTMRRSDNEDGFSGRRLHVLSEETPVEEMETQRHTMHIDNPLEGPSWLLDSPPDSKSSNRRDNLEPDSTTEPDRMAKTSCEKNGDSPEVNADVSVRVSCEFSPTVRRRKRTSTSPVTPRHQHYSPRPYARKSVSGRVLKVLVAKMRLDSDSESTSPSQRPGSPHQEPLIAFDAPSPNGATDSAVFVSETLNPHLFNKDLKTEPCTPERRTSQDKKTSRQNSQDHRDSQTDITAHNGTMDVENYVTYRTASQGGRKIRVRSRTVSQESSVQRSRVGSHDSRDSDSGSGGAGDAVSEGRTRRPRKMVTYKEKPLNRKLRR